MVAALTNVDSLLDAVEASDPSAMTISRVTLKHVLSHIKWVRRVISRHGITIRISLIECRHRILTGSKHTVIIHWVCLVEYPIRILTIWFLSVESKPTIIIHWVRLLVEFPTIFFKRTLDSFSFSLKLSKRSVRFLRRVLLL